ncbi:hypothetical protein FN846DRAFT_912553 [Sphaerosporella brunnea]|uniref:ATP-dependent DNA helicase n=1 Tax=Sphaerosporella brunnea TaxID=1250544 RepID=A0A5J5EG99_9PEZI|nr:hypothetical protein FN846DRAFT_912553 [Sphaerosporella brunnea]
MDEAIASYYRPGQLRFLFAHLLVDLATPAIELWERYKESLSLDFRLHAPSHAAEKQALHQIEAYLAARGAALADFGLSTGEHRPREVEMEIEAFESRMDVLWNQAQLAVSQMNPEQAICYHTVLDDCWSDGPHRLYFIDGKAGRGKTFLVRAICDTLRSQADIAIIAGSTALSATLYERGRTAHSVFGIPVLDASPFELWISDLQC